MALWRRALSLWLVVLALSQVGSTGSEEELSLDVSSSVLDFGTQLICVPKVLSVTLRATKKKVEVSGWESNDNQYFIPTFRPAVLSPDGGNLTLQVVYLPTRVREHSSVLIIKTSAGQVLIELAGKGEPNPYEIFPLEPVLIASSSIYQPEIVILNPDQQSSLLIQEVYTTEDFLHLRVKNKETWEIKPGDRQAIVSLAFQSPVAGEYRGFVRIKTNRMNFLMPVFLSVLDTGVHVRPQTLHLGVARRANAQEPFHLESSCPMPALSPQIPSRNCLVPVSILNFAHTPIKVLDVQIYPHRPLRLPGSKTFASSPSSSTPAVSVSFRSNVVTMPGQSNSESVFVSLDLSALTQRIQGNFTHKSESGQLVIHTNSTSSENRRLFITYKYEVVSGEVVVEPANISVAFQPTGVTTIQRDTPSRFDALAPELISFQIRNNFPVPAVIVGVSIVGNKLSFLHPAKVKNLIGTVLAPKPSPSHVSVDLTWRDPSLIDNGFALADETHGLLVTTNLTTTMAPVYFSHGYLKCHVVSSEDRTVLQSPAFLSIDFDLGKAPFAAWILFEFVCVNHNALPVTVLDLHADIQGGSTEYQVISSAQGTAYLFAETPFELQSQDQLVVKVSLPPEEAEDNQASVSTNRANSVHKTGQLVLTTERESFRAGFVVERVPVKLSCSLLDPADPSLSRAGPPHVTAMFGENTFLGVLIADVESLFPITLSLAPGLDSRILIDEFVDTLRPGKDVQIGRVYFTANNCEVDDVACLELLDRCIQHRTESRGSRMAEETQIELPVLLSTNVTGLSIKADFIVDRIICPTIVKSKSTVSFGRVSVGGEKTEYIRFQNPSAHSPISLTLSQADGWDFDIAEEQQEASTLSSVGFRFPAGSLGKPIVLQPGEEASVGPVIFAPLRGQPGNISSAVVVSNNLTGSELVVLDGNVDRCDFFIKPTEDVEVSLSTIRELTINLQEDNLRWIPGHSMLWEYDGQILAQEMLIDLHNPGPSLCNISTMRIIGNSNAFSTVTDSTFPAQIHPGELLNISILFNSDCASTTMTSALHIGFSSGEEQTIRLVARASPSLVDMCQRAMDHFVYSLISHLGVLVLFVALVYFFKPSFSLRSVTSQPELAFGMKKRSSGGIKGKHADSGSKSVRKSARPKKPVHHHPARKHDLSVNPSQSSASSESSSPSSSSSHEPFSDTENPSHHPTLDTETHSQTPAQLLHNHIHENNNDVEDNSERVEENTFPSSEIGTSESEESSLTEKKNIEGLSKKSGEEASEEIPVEPSEKRTEEPAEESTECQLESLVEEENQTNSDKPAETEKHTQQQTQPQTNQGEGEISRIDKPPKVESKFESRRGRGGKESSRREIGRHSGKQDTLAAVPASEVASNRAKIKPSATHRAKDPATTRQRGDRGGRFTRVPRTAETPQHTSKSVNLIPPHKVGGSTPEKPARTHHHASGVDPAWTGTAPSTVTTTQTAGRSGYLPLPTVREMAQVNETVRQELHSSVSASPLPPPSFSSGGHHENEYPDVGRSFLGPSLFPDPISRDSFFEMPSTFFSSSPSEPPTSFGLPDFSRMNIESTPPRRTVLPPPGLGRFDSTGEEESSELRPPVGILRALSLEEDDDEDIDRHLKSPKEDHLLGNLDYLS